MIVYTGCGWIAAFLGVISPFPAVMFSDLMIHPNFTWDHGWPFLVAIGVSTLICLIVGLIVNHGLPLRFTDKVPGTDLARGHTTFYVQLEFGRVFSLPLNLLGAMMSASFV